MREQCEDMKDVKLCLGGSTRMCTRGLARNFISTCLVCRGLLAAAVGASAVYMLMSERALVQGRTRRASLRRSRDAHR